MRLLDKRPSLERCTEAGWEAYDYFFDAPIGQDFIHALRPLGDFLYMPMLKEPFFKAESHHRIVKGIEGKTYFRAAAHQDYPELFEELDRLIDSLTQAR